MKTFRIQTYIPLTRRKSIHHLQEQDGPVSSWHMRLDDALDEAWELGGRRLVVSTGKARYHIVLTDRETPG